MFIIFSWLALRIISAGLFKLSEKKFDRKISDLLKKFDFQKLILITNHLKMKKIFTNPEIDRLNKIFLETSEDKVEHFQKLLICIAKGIYEREKYLHKEPLESDAFAEVIAKLWNKTNFEDITVCAIAYVEKYYNRQYKKLQYHSTREKKYGFFEAHSESAEENEQNYSSKDVLYVQDIIDENYSNKYLYFSKNWVDHNAENYNDPKISINDFYKTMEPFAKKVHQVLVRIYRNTAKKNIDEGKFKVKFLIYYLNKAYEVAPDDLAKRFATTKGSVYVSINHINRLINVAEVELRGLER